MTQNIARRAEWLYSLAYFGAFLMFMPLLVLLLPRRVEAIVGSGDITALSWLLLIGGVVASLAHILAGMWSDRWIIRFGNRRGLIALGVAGSVVAHIALGQAVTLVSLGMALTGFQIALNLAFAPLGALLADYIPDARKGRIAGRMNAAMPISIAAVSIVSWLFPQDSGAAFMTVGIAAAVMVLPLLVWWPFGDLQRRDIPAGYTDTALHGPRRDFLVAASARLMVQLGAVVMNSYLYAYLAHVALRGELRQLGTTTDAVGMLSLLAMVAAVLSSLSMGWLSDLRRARRIPLCASAVVVGCALLVLGVPPAWPVILIAYAVFHAALASFLSLDSALVAQIVSGHPRRGTLLGIMNLTNTLPAIIAPIVALLAIRTSGLGSALPGLITISACAALAAAAIITAIRSVR